MVEYQKDNFLSSIISFNCWYIPIIYQVGNGDVTMLFIWHVHCNLQQTNTADMLEEAVEYVKFLQKQIQVLPALSYFERLMSF